MFVVTLTLTLCSVLNFLSPVTCHLRPVFCTCQIFNVNCFYVFKVPLEAMSIVESEDMDMEENAPPDPHAGLRKELDALVTDSQVQFIKLLY